MMKYFAIFIVIFSALIMSVEAATWIELDNKLYIDRDSIDYTRTNLGQIVTFWTKELNDGTEVFKDLELKYKKKIWYTMNKNIVYCNTKKIGITDSIDYDLKGSVIKSYYYSSYDVSSIIPETYGEYFYTIVCPLE